MLSLFNLNVTRNEAKEYKLSDYLSKNSNLNNLYSKFRESWSNIAEKCDHYDCKILPIIKDLHPDLPLSFFLIDDKELGYGMYLASAMQVLGQIQNELIESIIYLKENNSNLFESAFDSKKYLIQKVSQFEIISCDTLEFEDLLTQYSKYYDIYQWDFGEGRNLVYDYEKIEKELSLKILTNKKLLNYSYLNKIEYKFELLSIQNKNSNLILDINTKLTQILLSSEENLYLKKILMKLYVINKV